MFNFEYPKLAKIMNTVNKNINLSAYVQQMIADNRLNDAVVRITSLLDADPNNAVLLFERGKLLWKVGRKADAMSDYAAAVQIDPSSPAATALQMARDVMDFYNRDLYNP